ncbi:Zinc finger, GRF-type [Sesbania bispinosa]|nr:Zinc finger, GRF-type [Sesbania bispinosa]
MGGEGIKGSKSYSSKRGTTSWSFASSSHPVPRLCKCGEQLLLLTSKTSNNPGRVFWRCRNWARKNSCNFFRWADEELSQEAAQEGCTYFPDQLAEEYKRKMMKYQKKLGAERAKGKCLMLSLFVSWVVIVGFSLVTAIKCNCTV